MWRALQDFNKDAHMQIICEVIIIHSAYLEVDLFIYLASLLQRPREKRQGKKSDFFLKDFFEPLLSTAVLGSEIVSSTTHNTIDESPVSNQYG